MNQYLADIETANDACVLVAPRSKREALATGMLARLVFAERPKQRERLWVKVTNRMPSPTGIIYTGELVSDTLIDDLEVGSEIVFGPQHITEWDVPLPTKARARSR